MLERAWERPLSIIFAGTDDSPGSNILKRCAWLRKLGYHVTYVSVALPCTRRWDPRRLRHLARMHGPGFDRVNLALLRACQEIRPELVWLDKGFTVFPETLAQIKQLGNPLLVAHNNDNPFICFPKVRRTWRHFLASIPLYDAHLVTQRYQVDQFLQMGAQKVLRIMSATDPETHRPQLPQLAPPGARDGIIFVGRWEPDRHEAAQALARCFGSQVRVYGPGWRNARSPVLRRRYCVHDAIYDEPYAAALGVALIALGFLTSWNPDFITRRSYEVPACGGCLLAKRTADHQRLLREGREAFFWSSTDELIDKARFLLAHPEVVQRVKEAAYRRSQELGFGYDQRIPRWLAFIFSERQLGDELLEVTGGEEAARTRATETMEG